MVRDDLDSDISDGLLKEYVRYMVWEQGIPFLPSNTVVIKNWLLNFNIVKDESEACVLVNKMLVMGLRNYRANIVDSDGSLICDLTKFARLIDAITEEDVIGKVREFMEENPKYESIWRLCVGELP